MGAIKRFWEEVALQMYGEVTHETLQKARREAERRLKRLSEEPRREKVEARK